MRRWPALLLGSILLQGCLLESRADRAGSEPASRLTVVPDEGPFDPSKAVEDSGPGELRASSRDRSEDQQEDVATEEVAEARAEQGEQALERIHEAAVDDDAAKASLASNPAPEDPGSGETWSRTLLDWVLELVIILVLALALALPAWLVLRALRPARGGWRWQASPAGRAHGT